jgi:Domain of unknown function (DUF4124)
MNTLHSFNWPGLQLSPTRFATFECCILSTRTQAKVICFGLLMLITMFASGAGIQKCVDAQGKVSYTDKPCQGTEKSKVIRAAPAQPTPALSNALRKACEADRLAMREKTVPIADLEKLKNRVAACAQLELRELLAASEAIDAAEAREWHAEFARKSPACQARWKELSALQSTMETSEETEHYIALQRVYERTCPSD